MDLRAGGQGATYRIDGSLLGASGSTPTNVSSDTFHMASSFGVVFSGGLRSPSNLDLAAGLWGGGATRGYSGQETVLSFGSGSQQARLVIPAGALSSDYSLYANVPTRSNFLNTLPESVEAATAQLRRSGNGYIFPLGDSFWEIFAQDLNGQRVRGLFNPPARLTLPFTDVDGDGVVDGTSPPVRTRTLSIWWLDEEHQNWVKVPAPRLDVPSRSLTVDIHHFSVYTVMGAPDFDPTDTYAYPVPWRPEGSQAGDGAGQTGSLATGIIFKNMPSVATIRIYAASGRLIRTIEHNDGALTRRWDGKADDGDDVATGTYTFVVESPGAKKKGRLAVIR